MREDDAVSYILRGKRKSRITASGEEFGDGDGYCVRDICDSCAI